MRLHHTLIFSVFCLISCSSSVITNKNHVGLLFSEFNSDSVLTDENGYGCGEIRLTDFSYLLRNSKIVTETDIHDYYSTVGCSITGSVLKRGERVEFVFDYGGIFYFSDGVIMACGKSCCHDSYEYCSWDIKTLSPDKPSLTK